MNGCGDRYKVKKIISFMIYTSVLNRDTNTQTNTQMKSNVNSSSCPHCLSMIICAEAGWLDYDKRTGSWAW